MEETITVGTPGGRKRPEDLGVDGTIIKMELKEVVWSAVKWFYLYQSFSIIFTREPD
jgi:hypothetical protein